MDKSYTVQCGHAPFDWGKWLDSAIEQLPPQEEIEMVARRAKDWPTCAVGNESALITRDCTGAPEDEILKRLGISFHVYLVQACCLDVAGVRLSIQAARQCFQEIQARAEILIARELATLNQR